MSGDGEASGKQISGVKRLRPLGFGVSLSLVGVPSFFPLISAPKLVLFSPCLGNLGGLLDARYGLGCIQWPYALFLI